MVVYVVYRYGWPESVMTRAELMAEGMKPKTKCMEARSEEARISDEGFR